MSRPQPYRVDWTTHPATLEDCSALLATQFESVDQMFQMLFDGIGASNLTTDITGILPVANGGTGFATYAIGDLLYADTIATLARLADVATGNALLSGGVGVTPLWGKVSLTTTISGVLPVANGGTNASAFTAGSVLFAGAAGLLFAQDNTNLFFDDATNQLVVGGSLLSPLLYGSSAANGDLTLEGTSSATKTTSYVLLQPTGGNVGIGTTSPILPLSVVTNASTAPIYLKTQPTYDAFSILPWSGGTHISSGIYYKNGVWVHDSSNTSNALFHIGPASGVTWYNSNNSTSSWNVASAVLLWDTTGSWKHLVQSTAAGNSYFTGGNVGIGTTTPTAVLHLKAGTATASTAPLKLTSGTLLTAAEAGAVEFLTNDFYGTITTGVARKKFVLDNGVDLVSGRIPFASTNGRLVDDADLTFSGDTLTATKISTTQAISTGSATNRAVNNKILYGATTDAATAVELTTDGGAGSGSTNRLSVPVDAAMSVVVNICVKQATSANSKQMLRQFLITNTGGTTTIEGAVTVLGTDVGSVALATVTTTITANNTDDCIKLEVNGLLATNLRYTAYVVSTETTYA